MSLEFSPVVTARRKVHSEGYSSFHLYEGAFDGLIDPVLTFDHFVMSEPFPARPRAGFIAVTYIFEDSHGGMLNRDSVAGTTESAPGSLQWTLTGKGLIHEESPLDASKKVEGIQLSVNLNATGKYLAPQVQSLKREEVPEWKPSVAVRGRVLLGRQGGVVSPVETSGSFTLIDLTLRARASYSPRVLPECTGMIYLMSGKLRVSSGENIALLEPMQAIGMRAAEKHGELIVEGLEDSRFLFVSGKALREPILAHGTFVMNTRSQIAECIAAYQRGEMGRLD